MKKKSIIIGIFLLIVVSFSSLVWKENISLTDEVLPTELAIFLEDQETNVIPSKESGYYFDRTKSSCNNGSIEWDSVNWNPNIKVNNDATTRTKCNLVFMKVYNEGILNGTDPVIKDELIPVKIEENGTVKKADLKSKWYEYANKEWANAVITRNSYDVLNNDGKVHGATKETDYVSLDGVDDYIDLGLANYDFGNKFTFIIKVKNNADTYSQFFNNYEGGGVGFYSFENSNGAYGFNFYNSATNTYVGIESSKQFLNKWVTLLASYDGQTLKLYINGTLEAEKVIVGSVKPSIMPFYLGANPEVSGNHSNYSNIDIKQVAMFDRVLSNEEINHMSDGIKIADNTGLVSYIDFTNKTNYEANEVIPEDIIESYFTWIPRYRYQIFDDGNYPTRTSDTSGLDNNAVQTIQVVFESKDTPVSNGSTVGSWLTHPAFTAFNSNGMWVGKFETSKFSGSDNARNGEAVQIKPNASSWRNIQVSNAFYTSYDYKRNLDSHMMKNMEWGAVAYLQHSIYGSRESVRMNNNSSYITGYAANNEPTCGYTGTNETCNKYCDDGTCNQPYNTSVGYTASTTRNVSGIYDMAGGSWEYVMGVMLDEAGNPVSGRNNLYNSGFNGTLTCPTCDTASGNDSSITNITNGYEWPEVKYYDTYSYQNNDEHYERRILGDATGETGSFGTTRYLAESRVVNSWYNDEAYFVCSAIPWFVRGAAPTYGVYTGIFTFSNHYGAPWDHLSFRVVLTP